MAASDTDFRPLARFIKHGISTALATTPDNILSETASRKAFDALIAAANHFLIAGGESPLPDTLQESRTFALHLRDFMENLTHYDNPTNENEAGLLVESESFNRQFAALLEATHHYLRAAHTPIDAQGISFDCPDSTEEENIRPRLWKRVTRMENDNLISELVEVEHIDFSKKPVICSGGLSCFHTNNRGLNGFLKIVEQALGGYHIHEQGIELYIVSHPIAHKSFFQHRTHAYNANPLHYASTSAEQFVQHIMLPMLGLEEALKPPYQS